MKQHILELMSLIILTNEEDKILTIDNNIKLKFTENPTLVILKIL